MNYKLVTSYSALLLLLRRSLFGVSEQWNGENIEWNDVYLAAKEHAVTTIALDGTGGLEASEGISPELKSNWNKDAYTFIGFGEKLSRVQESCLHLLDENGIGCVVIKGSSAAKFYSKPYLRIHGDIDLLVSKEDFQSACELLERNGYISQKEDAPHHCHKSFIKNGCIIELHFEVNGLPSNELGDKFSKLFDNFYASSVSAELDGHRFKMLSNELHGLTLLLHIYEHLCKTGLGLRQLCDWAVYVNCGVTEEFISKLKEFGLYKLAQTVTKICVLYLGVNENACTWCVDADDETCFELLNDFIDSGNFGRRKGNNYHGSNLFIVHTKDKQNIFTNFAEIAYSSWPVCYKFKPLLIISPFVIGVRYIYRTIIGKRERVNLFVMFSKSNKRNSLYKKLKVFEKGDA